MNSRPNSANSGRGGDERRLSFFLNHCKKRVQLLDPVLRQLDRRHQPLIGRRYSLTDLLYVDAHRRRDVVHVVGNCAGVPHDWIDVAIDAVQHVADLSVTLPEVPRRRHERDGQYEQRDRCESACVRGDLLKQSRVCHHLLGDERVRQSPGGLQQPSGPRQQPCGHGWVMCKGKAILGCSSSNGTKSAGSDILA